MWTKEELKNLFEDTVKRCEEETDECQRQLAELRGRMDEISDEKYYREFQATKNQLLETLDDSGKELYGKREKLKKRKTRAKWWGVPLLLFYLFLAYRFLFVFKPEFSAPDIAVYAIAIGIAVFIYFIPVIIRRVVLTMKIVSINRETQIQELDKKIAEAFNNYCKNVSDSKNIFNKYKREAESLMANIRKLDERKREGLHQLDELDFNCAYAGCVLFYGKEKRNHYDIYIDGHHYDTVRGHQIIQIRLTEGLHFLKFENTSYNLADKTDVVYSWSFNTQQIEVGDVPEAYAFVCEYKTLKRISGEDFQTITKTRLI